MARVTRHDWLEEGLKAIAEGGFAALTLEHLLARLGVTHGSFYHHFQNRRAYTEALLAHWTATLTEQVQAETRGIPVLSERVEALVAKGQALPHQQALEHAIRSEAANDMLVRRYVEAVDASRLAHCRELARLACHGSPDADTIGNLVHAVFVGTQHVLPAFTPEQVTDIYRLMTRLVTETYAPPGDNTDKEAP
jgi:AcrR family transcriptional regulator